MKVYLAKGADKNLYHIDHEKSTKSRLEERKTLRKRLSKGLCNFLFLCYERLNKLLLFLLQKVQKINLLVTFISFLKLNSFRIHNVSRKSVFGYAN